jgi:hypothetical protein
MAITARITGSMEYFELADWKYWSYWAQGEPMVV